MRYFFYFIYFPLKRLIEILTTIDISEHATIGGGLFVAHLGNIVIGHHSSIGCNASIHQGVTVGGMGESAEFPQIGDRVYFGAGSKIIGPVRVGNDVVIGANAVVTKDIPDSAVVAGIPARVINYKSSRDFIRFRNRNVQDAMHRE